MDMPQIIKNKIMYDPSILPPGCLPRGKYAEMPQRYQDVCLYCSVIYSHCQMSKREQKITVMRVHSGVGVSLDSKKLKFCHLLEKWIELETILLG